MTRAVFIGGTPVINNLTDANNYSVNIDKYETIQQSLYDSAAYATGGQNQLAFFGQPQGAGISAVSGLPKTLEDTNMTAAGSLPNMQAYIVTSVEIDVQPGFGDPQSLFPAGVQPADFGAEAVATSINDAWIIRATGYLQFTIGSKPYLQEGPLMKFPASNDLEIDAAVCDASTAGADLQTRISYAKSVGPAYILAPNNLLLIPMQNFSVTLNWSTPQAVTTTARLFVRLMGQLLRSAQ
jgi:hypothetical protein